MPNAERRRTEVGEIPTDWDLKTVADCFEIQQGKALNKKAREGKAPFPFLRTANVFWGHVDLTKLDEMDFNEDEVKKLCLQPGDLLVCEGGDIGRTAMWEGQIDQCMHQNHLHRLRSHRDVVEPRFFMYWMQVAVTQLDLYAGQGNKTTIPNLSRQRLSGFLFPLPPLAEQRAIAHVLRTVQRAKEATEKVLAATKQLKQSLLRHLFTYGPVPFDQADQVELKETEIGPMPEHWEVVPLESVVNGTQYGLSIRGEQIGRYPILRMNNLVGGRIDATDLQYVDIDGDEFAKFQLRRGDILFNRTNSFELVGKASIFDLEQDFVFASYLIRVAAKETQLLPHFLNYFLNLPTTQAALKMLATRGVSQSNINATKLKGIRIAIPPIDEQRIAVDRLSVVEQKLEAEQARHRALANLFTTLLHHLMTGKVRVV